MSWLAWALVIFLTALAATLGTAVLTGRGNRPSLDRLADPAPLPGELPIAGRLPYEVMHDHQPGEPCNGFCLKPMQIFDLPEVLAKTGTYGPFPVDTGPLLILSDKMAANVALEREIRALGDKAEAKIPPRWR